MTTGLMDRVEFARRVLRRDPFPHQEDALRSSATYVAITGGRRSGKTECQQVAALHACFTRRNATALLTSANADSTRRWLEDCVGLLRGAGAARDAVLDETGARLNFTNGSRILALPPTSAQLRGRGADVFWVGIDEAGHAPPGLWRDLRYTLLDHLHDGAQGWLVGSPWGGPEHFFWQTWRQGEDGDEDVASFRWPSALNPRLPHDWIERERARLNGIEAMAELDGEWTEDGLQFFSRALLDRCVADVELPDVLAVGGDAKGILGVDFGVAYDRSAACGVFRVPVGRLNPDLPPGPRFVLVPKVWDHATPLTTVTEEVIAGRTRWRWVVCETNGIGSMPAEVIGRGLAAHRKAEDGWHWRHPVNTTQAKKLTGFGAWLWLMEQDRVVLPREPLLLRQFAGLRLEHTVQGQRISAEDPAVHDDICDAAYLASLPVVANGGQTIAHLSRLADVRAASPDAALAAFREPVVETGAGVRVWQRPVLQSVVDGGLSFPDGFDRRPPAAEVDPAYADARAGVRAALKRIEQEAPSG